MLRGKRGEREEKRQKRDLTGGKSKSNGIKRTLTKRYGNLQRDFRVKNYRDFILTRC